ncbi:MAG TPA: LysR family transcriptional regulator [Polyangiaceae bacterium]|jgi:DNA-binding transcriptional LysR family regulator|nr:LysR family transcriptional regulator [Polyangiaceae bacterium]
MTASAPGWELYRSFLAVFHERSLSGAARALSLTQPTIGRHVDVLEEALGVSLFTRSRSGLEATAEAAALVPYAETMASAAAALQRAASGEGKEERGSVRITASEMIGAEVLPSILTSFREAHPRIDVELVLSNRAEDLLRRDADVAIRMVRPTQAALVTRRLGVVRIGLHAHPRYAKAHGLPTTLEELAAHSLIGFDRNPSVSRLPDVGFVIRRERFAFRCESDLGQYAALRAGFGLGFCQVTLARRDRLLPVLPDLVGFELGVWVAMHEDLAATRRVRLLFDHVATHLKAHIDAGKHDGERKAPRRRQSVDVAE